MTDIDVSDDTVSNRSGNRPFEDVVASRFGRRSALKGSLIGAAAFLTGSAGLAGTSLASPRPAGGAAGASQARMSALLGFTGIPGSNADEVLVPEGYQTQVLARWGDGITPSAPAWRKDASNPSWHQLHQLGMGHDGMAYFPIGKGDKGNRRGLLAMNHEYTVDAQLFPDGTENWTHKKTKKSQWAHGVSIVEIRLIDDTWQIVDSTYARRIHVRTPMGYSGMARGHRLLKTDIDPRGTKGKGTANNCSMGVTPWNTYVTCEENFNGYFHELGEGTLTDEQQALFDRYGVGGRGFGYKWAETDTRFRADLNPNEPNKFGWVVEIDPFKPNSRPVKRTAGRFKHEGATFTTAPDGRAVCYSGDDERFDYLYKFVSAKPWKKMVARGQSPLNRGTLYVARFNDDGSGVWMPLVQGTGPLTAANGFADQGDVLVKTRLAADALGATPMDRPEWTAVHPYTGEVYVTLTNNTARTPEQVNGANPRPANQWGHIIRFRERELRGRGYNGSATEFDWDIYMLCGPGDGVDGSTIPAESAFGSPDGLWFDPDGRLWIQTDGSQPGEVNDQMLAADPTTGEVKRFLTGVPNCEITGVTSTPDGSTLFCNVQHPGDRGGPDNPTETSTWPDGDPDGRPRPATVAIRRTDGGVVGS